MEPEDIIQSLREFSMPQEKKAYEKLDQAVASSRAFRMGPAAPDPREPYDQFRQRTDLLVRQRFFLGLRDAFEAVPELSEIACRFAPNHRLPSQRTLGRDVEPTLPMEEKKLLARTEKHLKAMRIALGPLKETYWVISGFFENKDQVLNRELVTQCFDMLLDPQNKHFNRAAFEAELQSQALDAQTPRAIPPASRRGPRL